MAARKASIEAGRAERFATWKAALEKHDGNVSRATREIYPEITRKQANARGAAALAKLGLRQYAADLREKATGRRGAGRPRQT